MYEQKIYPLFSRLPENSVTGINRKPDLSDAPPAFDLKTIGAFIPRKFGKSEFAVQKGNEFLER